MVYDGTLPQFSHLNPTLALLESYGVQTRMKEAWLATEKKKVWENDEPFSPADEWSESVLCLGRPTDESSREVVF